MLVGSFQMRLARLRSLTGSVAIRREASDQARIRGVVPGRKGLVLGAWESCENEKLKLTPVAEAVDSQLGGKLTERFKPLTTKGLKKGWVEVSHDLDGWYAVALAGIGPEGQGFNSLERLHECRDDVRRAAARGLNFLIRQECETVCVDPMTCADATAEGAKLASWIYQDFKTPPRIAQPEINLYSQETQVVDAWNRGSIMADGQNTARYLTESPSNVMTPRHFAEETIRILCPCGVHVHVRPIRWIEDHKMFAFLNMAKGSCEPPYFLEINYCGGSEADRPVVLCGKGVTFDSGGLCLKVCRPYPTFKLQGDMAEKKASNTGAASIVGTIKALARLGVPVNVVGLIPLFENMPGGASMKPGDVLMTSNGRTIVIEDTDNEGRIALADTLIYSDHFKPCLDVVAGNISVGVRSALGSGATGVFSTSHVVWDELDKAGATTGDRVWRLPLWKNYTNRIVKCPHVDTCNTGVGHPEATPCLGAAFLYEFVPGCDYLHLDTTGTGLMTQGHYAPYLRAGFMTGRPTRTLVQFINSMACPLDKSEPCSGQP